jgi:hypothetical protein
MKRSEINRHIAEAGSFFAENRFVLPPYANWTPEEWLKRGSEAHELRSQRLGWDVTDFNAGRFESLGLTLFTLRNGSPEGGAGGKIYAEKIMFVRQDQVTPFHYHGRKTEDIINRGGKGTGRLAVKLYNSSPEGGLAQTPVSVVCDGLRRDGHGLIGEVSSVNDDDTDNFFLEPLPRYPEIVEDEPPLRMLCNEYGLA